MFNVPFIASYEERDDEQDNSKYKNMFWTLTSVPEEPLKIFATCPQPTQNDYATHQLRIPVRGDTAHGTFCFFDTSGDKSESFSLIKRLKL